jgi:hypothetical protein
MNHGGKTNAAADVEDADSLGRVDLVTGEREKVNVLEEAVWADVEGKLAASLYGVGVEESAARVRDSRERVDGLDDASLVVGVHDADETRVGLERAQECCRLNDALRSDGKEGDLYATGYQ